MLAAHPAAWTVAALVILSAQTGYWFDVSWDPGHRPSDPAALFGRGAGALSFWCPIIAIILMAAATNGGRPQELGPGRMARNLAGVTIVLLMTAIAAAIALMPGSLAATALFPWNDIGPIHSMRWLPSLELTGKALWIGAAYGGLSALVVTATGSRAAGCALAIIWALAENIVMDLGTRWWSSLWWVEGILPSNMYHHWTGDPRTTLGSMKNILGLEDGTQAFLVLAMHIALTCAATLVLAGWRARRRSRRENAGGTQRSTTPAADRPPDRRAWKYAGAAALAVVMVPTIIGSYATAVTEKPTPRQIAERHIRLNLNQTARQVAQAVAPDHPREDLIAEEFRSSIAGSVFGYSCGGEDQRLEPHVELDVSCSVSAVLVDSLKTHMTVPITVSIQDDQRRGRGRPRITGVEVHPDRIIRHKTNLTPAD